MTQNLLAPEHTFSLVSVAATACAAVLVLSACGPSTEAPTRDSNYAAAQSTVPARTAQVVNTAPAHTHPRTVVAQQPAARADMGRISRIETITTPGKTNGTGAIIGGVLGAAVGNQVGDHRDSKAIGTGLGAVGGAVLGSEIERRNRPATTHYRIHVRLDNGDERSFDASGNDGLRVGDRVRVDGTLLRRA